MKIKKQKVICRIIDVDNYHTQKDKRVCVCPRTASFSFNNVRHNNKIEEKRREENDDKSFKS
jgi:hypothetical protein